MVSSPLFGSEPPQLRIGEALSDGWKAFQRAPGPFVIFALLSGVLTMLASGLQQLGTPAEGATLTAFGALLKLVGSLLSIVVSLWASTGMLRGAWSALEGGRPQLPTFTRLDWAALRRLFLSQITLGILLVVIVVVAAVIGAGLAQLNEVLVAIPAIVAAVVILYLSITQMFLAQIALLEGPGPIATIQRGRTVVDPSWWRFLLLALLKSVLILVGLALCGVGLLVAVPLVWCVGTAAYRQVLGSEDLTGLLRGEEA
jgi:hypothetical protein